MKKGKNKASKGSKRRQKVQNGQVGAVGVATAPRKLPFLNLPMVSEGKPGLGPVSTERADVRDRAPESLIVPVSELKTAVARGDDGKLYFAFRARDRVKVIRCEEITQQPAKVWGQITDLGVLATSKADKAAVKEMLDHPVEDLATIVATRSGYEHGHAPRYHVYGDGSVITPHPELRIHSLSPVVAGFSQRGDLEAYEQSLSRLLRDQAIPLTVFLVGLSEILKPFVAPAGFDNQNMMIDLVGKSTNYKTALTSGIAGSAWGSPDRQNGYARRWNMTEQKIEDFFRQFNGHLLVLDEATLAHTDPKKRGEIIANVAFRLASGMGRARTGEEIVSHSLTVLSSSNDTMEKILEASPEGREALGVRLVSFAMPERPTRFFDSVPDGFRSIPEAMTANFAVIREHHGLLARRLIMDILSWVKDDRAGLITFIKSSMDKFLRRAGFEDSDAGDTEYRRIQPLAIAYATAKAAFKTGALRRSLWGNVLRTILRAWRKYGQKRSTRSSDPRFTSYMEDSSNVFVDVRQGQLREVSDQEFADIAGFIHRGRDGEVYLSVSKSACVNKLGFNSAMLKRLKQEGVLRGGKGLLTKLNLRCTRGQKRRDAFYRFRLLGVSPKTRFR